MNPFRQTQTRQLLAGLALLAAVACGQDKQTARGVDESQSKEDVRASELFPDSLLREYLRWSPVLPGNGEFMSVGHGGPLVRAFYNDTAKPVYEDNAAFPLPVGSIIAKAVINDSGDPTSSARRVYFMRKMGSDYDPTNNNWAYAFAERSGNDYQYNPNQGRVALCIDCHKRQRQFDFVKTVKIHRDGHP